MIQAAEIATNKWLVLLLWLVATMIAMFLSLMVIEAAYFQGDYVPTGNDSFYHARRMLDVAVGERGFYQFDERIGAPDGLWVPWPWAYDWLLGQAAALAVLLSPSTDPMGFLAHVPVAWLAVNAALFLAALRCSGLRLSYCAIAMLMFSIAPFVQLMHMVGKVDHHFAEFTFVLLVTWLGLRWFSASEDRASAIGLGAALGLAPGFHNGLFVLLIPVLVCAGILWLRGQQLSRPSLHLLAFSLMVTTFLIVVPSLPFQNGMFEFGLLSGFHLYVAACSSAVLTFFGWKTFDKKSLAILIGVCAVLVLPILGQLTHGTAFLSRDLSFLENVIEAMGPFTLIQRFGLSWTVAHYSWLLLGTPLLLVYFTWAAIRSREPRALFFSVMTVFGLAFMLMQFRFNYCGLFAMIAGTLMIVQQFAKRFESQQGLVTIVVLGGVLIAYQPPLRDKLFDVYALGGAPLYERARPAFLDLAEQCAEDPGLILADKHDGNYLLFHTDCSVVSNNFMLTEEDVLRVERFSAVMRLTPEEMRLKHPDIKYVLLRAWDFYENRDGKFSVASGFPLATALLSERALPEGFEELHSISVEREGQSLLYAKVFSVR